MIILYLFLFVASFMLYTWGGLNSWLGLAIMVTSLAACFYYFLRWVLWFFRIRIFKRREQVEGAIYVEHLYGFPLFERQRITLYVDQESLGFDSFGWRDKFALKGLNSIYVLPAKTDYLEGHLASDQADLCSDQKIVLRRALNGQEFKFGESLLLIKAEEEGEGSACFAVGTRVSKSRLRKLFSTAGINDQLKFL